VVNFCDGAPFDLNILAVSLLQIALVLHDTGMAMLFLPESGLVDHLDLIVWAGFRSVRHFPVTVSSSSFELSTSRHL
jgi:hypothetical protein